MFSNCEQLRMERMEADSMVAVCFRCDTNNFAPACFHSASTGAMET